MVVATRSKSTSSTATNGLSERLGNARVGNGEVDAESPTEAFRESSRLVCPGGVTRTLAGNGSRRETMAGPLGPLRRPSASHGPRRDGTSGRSSARSRPRIRRGPPNVPGDTARQNGCVIEKFLAPVSSLPKSSATRIFSVGTSGDRFAQAAHEPGEAGQPPTAFCERVLVGCQHSQFVRFGFCRLALIIAAFGEKTPPAASDFFVGPRVHHIRPGSEDGVKVV